MEKADVVIIGAGIIGLSIAAEVSRFKNHVYVLERHDSFGRETSSRNSEVIHAGIYYPKDSLKAKTCLEGNRLIYQTCLKHNIPYKNLGKLIVTAEGSQALRLEALFKNAKESGADGLELLSEDKIRKLEPNIKAKAAIYSKTTGIVDSHSLMKYYAFKLQQNKATISYNTEVKDIKKTNGAYEVFVSDNSNETFTVSSQIVINCAGLQSDTIAALAGIDTKRQSYTLKYCKGQYFNIANKKSALIKRLIYPAPLDDSGGLGIHATPNLSGAIRLGPDDKYIERNDVDYNVNENDRIKFYNSAVNFLPFIEPYDLIPDTAGIRPKLQGPGEGFRDFVIKEEEGIGFPGFINLIGIESPGLTSAPSIARIVSSMLR
jgi:L-2-hydroxyglutarate oxidase LhgO